MISYVYVYILGVLSILSACTIIIIPVLLSQVLSKRKKLYTAISFSLGFSFLFSILGAVAGFMGDVILARYEPYLLIFAAIVTFAMALKFFKVIKFHIPSLHVKSFPKTNSFFLGAIFGFVALSCISPLLGVVFVFAIMQKSIVASIATFLIYSLGYATPLIAASTIFEEKKIMSFMTKNRNKVDIVSGLLLLFATIYLVLVFFGVILLV